MRLTIARSRANVLVQALRDLDALVLDVRAMSLSLDLQVSEVVDMWGAFLCRPGH